MGAIHKQEFFWGEKKVQRVRRNTFLDSTQLL